MHRDAPQHNDQSKHEGEMMEESQDRRLSRRELLVKAGIVTVAAGAATAVPTVLSACGSGEAATAASSAASTTTLFPGGADVDTAIAAKLKGKTVKVGFTPPVLSEFFNEMEMAAFWALKEFEDRFGINWVWERAAPSGNFETVQEHFNIVQNWVQAGFDVIAICSAIDLEARNKLYTQAIEGGAAVYEFNQPNELWPVEDQVMQSSITYDNVLQSGYAAGSYIAEKLGGKGDIIQIWGPSGHWAEARQKGLDMALAENPGLKVVAKADGGYVRDKGFAAAQNLLQRYPDVNAIYGENEEMALGASQAIDVAGLEHWDPETGKGILTIGADGLMTGFKAIKDGRLTATVYVGTVDQGIGIAKTILYNRLLGMSVDKIQNQPCVVVDKDNVQIYEALTQWALAAPKKY
jgi:ABC-type sugar transport system substrate-binding protein